jgi:TolB-like protein
MLLERRGEIVTRDELKQTLWPADTFVDFDDGLNTAVKKIRDLLGDSAEKPRYIETIPRRGYRFAGTIEQPPNVLNAVNVTGDDARSAVPLPLVQAAAWRRPLGFAVSAAAGALVLVVILVGAGGGRRARLFGHAAAPRIESLAVLPLANLSGDPEQDYFADGMTETLIANLAQVKTLRVISRTSVMRYKGTKQPLLPEIARDLNVDAIIEGAVQRSGNRIRVTAQLIHGQTDVHLWAKTYERDSQDVMMIQNELAQAIVGEIKIKLTPQERQHFASARAVNSDAYNAYLRGNFHAQKRTLAGSDKAIECFQEATRIDPRYAQAYAALASAYIERDVWGGFGIGKSADQVRANALKALELDSDLAEAHSLLGWIHFQYDWDWERTETELNRAIELNANLPSSYQRYAFFLQAMGRDQEALVAVHRAVELDPLSPLYLSDEGRILYRERDYQRSIAQ